MDVGNTDVSTPVPRNFRFAGDMFKTQSFQMPVSVLAIMHELTARPVSSLIASEQMNLAGVREWTCKSRSGHWQAGHGSSRTSYITDEQYLRL
jgi:hypothetical protein